jgi:glycerate kinase
MIVKMDAWLANYAALTKTVFPTADAEYPGSGAAGGMGFALREYLGGELVSGVSLVLDATRLETFVRDADVVITGEGRIDAQTAMGKAPGGVAAIAKKHGKPCIAFAGSVTADARACNDTIDAFFPIRRSICTLAEAMEPSRAASELADTAEQVFRLIGAIV